MNNILYRIIFVFLLTPENFYDYMLKNIKKKTRACDY